MADDDQQVNESRTGTDGVPEDMTLPSFLDEKRIEVTDMFLDCWAGPGFTRPWRR